MWKLWVRVWTQHLNTTTKIWPMQLRNKTIGKGDKKSFRNMCKFVQEITDYGTPGFEQALDTVIKWYPMLIERWKYFKTKTQTCQTTIYLIPQVLSTKQKMNSLYTYLSVDWYKHSIPLKLNTYTCIVIICCYLGIINFNESCNIVNTIEKIIDLLAIQMICKSMW